MPETPATPEKPSPFLALADLIENRLDDAHQHRDEVMAYDDLAMLLAQAIYGSEVMAGLLAEARLGALNDAVEAIEASVPPLDATMSRAVAVASRREAVSIVKALTKKI